MGSLEGPPSGAYSRKDANLRLMLPEFSRFREFPGRTCEIMRQEAHFTYHPVLHKG